MATPVGDAIPIPSDTRIDELVQGGQWQFGDGPRVLTYAFETESDFGIKWTSAMKAAVRDAFAEWEKVVDLSFVEVAPSSDIDSSSADLAIALTGNLLRTVFGAAGLALFPDPQAADDLLASLELTRADSPNAEGDIYLDSVVFASAHAGGIGREILLHEIGHALGLKHVEDNGLNGRPSLPAADPGVTVMSNAPRNLSLQSGNAATPLLHDILAMQLLYGKNMSYAAGDDVHLVQPGARSVIWDSGGIDTLDFSATAGAAISLAAGSQMVFAGGEVRIAFEVDIENAIGSRFDDFLLGSAGANRLEGGRGNDSYLLDNAGDVLVEHAGEGIDTIEAAVAIAAMPEHFEHFVYFDSLGPADVAGNALSNFITGNTAANRLEGGAGDDTLDGVTGPDTLAGGTGNDEYRAGADVPEIMERESEGIDTLLALGPATLPANVENLVFQGLGVGNALRNLITTTHAGADTLDGRGGSDTLAGGKGDDTYYVDGGDLIIDTGGRDTAFSHMSLLSGHPIEVATLLGRAGNGTIASSTAANAFTGNNGANLIDGGAGDDTLAGGSGDDTLLGGTGTDRLDGGHGADVMEGGAGNDVYVVSGVRDRIVEAAKGGTDTVELHAARYTLDANVEDVVLLNPGGSIVTGNALANRFFFESLQGVDRILGFQHGVDKIVLDDAVFSNPADVEYVGSTGELLYDGVLFALLEDQPAFAAADLQFA